MPRVERLLNLAAALSHTRRPLTLAEIRAVVPGYSEGEAGRRAFERDKDELRGLGFDLRAEETAGEPPELGYRLRPEDWTMGELDLAPDEAAALALAASVARLEGEGAEAEAGMRAAGRLASFVSEVTEPTLSARLGEASPFHSIVADAVSRRRVLAFAYRGEERHLAPYGMVLRNGRWYVAGHDLDRDAIRAFRLDRIDEAPSPGEPNGFERPDDFDPATAVPAEPWTGTEETQIVRLLLDSDVAWWARRQLGRPAVIEEREDGSVVVDVEVAIPRAFISFVASLLDSAEILSPPEMRRALIAHVGGSEAQGG